MNQYCGWPKYTILSFMNGVSKENIVNRKVSKRALKYFICPFVNGRACICLCVCVSVCLFVWIKKLNKFWWYERILMKFSGSVQLCTSNFWVAISDQPAPRVWPWVENGLRMDKLKQTGRALGRVSNFWSGCMHTMHLLPSVAIWHNLELKTQPKQLLGSLALVIMLPSLCLGNLSPPEFLSYRGIKCLFRNLRPRARKNGESNFGVGSKILEFEWVPLHK
jgi:hypothetical protein